jgi:phosphoenolpyruvate synthase/pyruvate phosphate dikinase
MVARRLAAHGASMKRGRYVIPFSELRMTDVASVGGKNASLGEMLSQLAEEGIRVPDGFATTADAFRDFLRDARLVERINARLDALDVDDVKALVDRGRDPRLGRGGAVSGRAWSEIRHIINGLRKCSSSEISVAVRSSATAEDLPDASFAGQQETYLNVAASTPCWRASSRCSPRCTTTAPSPTGCTRASCTPTWRCRPACSGWCAATSAPPA